MMDRFKFVVRACWSSWAVAGVGLTMFLLVSPHNKTPIVITCVTLLLLEQLALALSKFETTQNLRNMWSAAEMLWVMLANVSGGDWSKQSAEWQHYAGVWRDNYHSHIPLDVERLPQETAGSFRARRVT